MSIETGVLSVITDIKLPVLAEDGTTIISYTAVVVSATDYSAFGVALYGRSWTMPNADDYRYGFQNQEEDKELWEGAVTYKYRVEDARLGRFFSVDPLVFKYPNNSPYAFQENKMGLGRELEGCELGAMNYLWKEAPVITQSDFNDVQRQVEPVARIAGNVLLIAGDVVAIVVTGGTAAAPLSTAFAVISGSMSIAAGTAKITLDIAGIPEMADKVPTSYLDATVGITLKYTLDGTSMEKYVEVSRAALNVVEGVMTLDINKLPDNMLKATDLAITSVSIIDDTVETFQEAKKLVTNNNKESTTTNSTKAKTVTASKDEPTKNLLKTQTIEVLPRDKQSTEPNAPILPIERK